MLALLATSQQSKKEPIYLTNVEFEGYPTTPLRIPLVDRRNLALAASYAAKVTRGWDPYRGMTWSLTLSNTCSRLNLRPTETTKLAILLMRFKDGFILRMLGLFFTT